VLFRSAMAATLSPPKTDLAVSVQDLTKRYGSVEALRGVSFEMKRGEVFGLLGPNGAGKTTTIEIIEGLRQADGGEVRVLGMDPYRQSLEVRRRIGGQLQELALPDKIRVKEALQLFAGYYPVHEDADALLSRLSLSDKANAYFETLSGGQKQRLSLALALVNRPEVVFLDEPTAGLDAQVRRELHVIIEELRAEGRTLLLTTHYIEEAEKLCDRVAILDHGRIIAEGTPKELTARSQLTARIEFRASGALSDADINGIADVSGIERRPDGTMVLKTQHSTIALVALVRLIEQRRLELTDLHITKPSLEDLFLELTGKTIRE